MCTEPEFHETTRLAVLRLDVEVRGGAIGIRLLPAQRSFVRLPVRDVEEARVDVYSAREHGGWHWGMRSSPRGTTTVYRLRGDRGVWLELADGRRVFIGSQRPRELRDAIVRAG